MKEKTQPTCPPNNQGMRELGPWGCFERAEWSPRSRCFKMACLLTIRECRHFWYFWEVVKGGGLLRIDLN